MTKHENNGVTYSAVDGTYKCKNCGKRYHDKEDDTCEAS